MEKREFRILYGHLACFIAYAIFGLNVIVCKDLTGSGTFSPLTLFSIRSLGAGILFWAISLFLPKEKVDIKDLPKIAAASFLGFFLTQITFLVAIPQVTPMTCSIISTLTPVYTMFIAAIAIKEPLSVKKIIGVATSLFGIIYLILNSVGRSSDIVENSVFGIVMIFLNGLSFALYLGIFRPLIGKYSVVTFMKWIFLFSIIMSVPFSAKEIVTAQWASIPSTILWELLFLVIMATFVSYFLIPIGQKALRPTLVSMYSYIQPIIAIVASIILGMDTLTWNKVAATLLVFAGVGIVNGSRKKKLNN